MVKRANWSWRFLSVSRAPVSRPCLLCALASARNGWMAGWLDDSWLLLDMRGPKVDEMVALRNPNPTPIAAANRHEETWKERQAAPACARRGGLPTPIGQRPQVRVCGGCCDWRGGLQFNPPDASAAGAKWRSIGLICTICPLAISAGLPELFLAIFSIPPARLPTPRSSSLHDSTACSSDDQRQSANPRKAHLNLCSWAFLACLSPHQHP